MTPNSLLTKLFLVYSVGTKLCLKTRLFVPKIIYSMMNSFKVLCPKQYLRKNMKLFRLEVSKKEKDEKEFIIKSKTKLQELI